MIGFAMCGSYCTHAEALKVLKVLAEKHDTLPILSENAYCTDTRFGQSSNLILELERLSGHQVIHTIKEAEPLGPKVSLDCLVICPCTGNTLAKLALGVTDMAVTMAAKAHLRCGRPLVIALASNDAMSANLGNIGKLLTRKNIYFVPMLQDDPIKKPHSLVADFSMIEKTLDCAMSGKQIRKLFL